MTTKLLSAGVALLITCAEVQAQTSAAFEDLAQRLERDESVTIIDITGRRISGRLIEVTPESLAIERPGSAAQDRYRFTKQDIRQVNSAADPLWNGVVIGAASGFIGGCIGGYTTFDPDAFNLLTETATDACLLAGIVSAGIGSGAGAVIDWAFGRHGTPVYKANRRVGMTTSLRPGHAALNIGFRW